MTTPRSDTGPTGSGFCLPQVRCRTTITLISVPTILTAARIRGILGGSFDIEKGVCGEGIHHQ